MGYKEKLMEFIYDLNKMSADYGEFELELKSGMTKVSDSEDVDAVKVLLSFKYNQMSHPIYNRIIIDEREYSRVYFDILRESMFSIDCVRQMKDNFGNDVNTLSFATLLTEGLQKLKTT